ncbi:MAG: hypothetical protein Q9203_005446 [Teloschistes exilis]
MEADLLHDINGARPRVPGRPGVLYIPTRPLSTVLHHKNSYMNNERKFEFMVAPIRAICILSLNSTEHLGSMQFHLLYQRFLVLPEISLPPTKPLLWSTHDYLWDHHLPTALDILSFVTKASYIHFLTFIIYLYPVSSLLGQRPLLPQWLISNLGGGHRPSFSVAFASAPAVDMTRLSTLLESGVNA